MRLQAIVIENFRAYKKRTRVEIGDLTAFIGRNDVGKSTILEALEIFFNSKLVKIDTNDACKAGADKTVLIGCVFDCLPETLIIDEKAPTTLAGEYLVNEHGELEIHQYFNCGLKTIKVETFAWAKHPSAKGLDNLLSLKHGDLKRRLEDSTTPSVDKLDLRANPPIRRALWDSASELQLKSRKVSLSDEDGKRIWDRLQDELPTFALFQSDRPSKDEDAEVQDPMKLAVSDALKGLTSELRGIQEEIERQTQEVANRTLEKLREIDPALASQLHPTFKADPKWDTLFKMTLTGDQEIPINKRGSGVRRLVLLSFFRAQAEQARERGNRPGVILAIEEPETSQHPIFQRQIIETLISLSHNSSYQVILTTHVPALAGLLPTESLRYVKATAAGPEIEVGTSEVFREVANDLGVLPDNRVRVFVCVEGPTDVDYLRHFSKLYHAADDSLPDLSTDPRVAFFPLGGSTLRQWVDEHYLRELGRPEIHIYDRGMDTPPRYGGAVAEVNARGEGSCAVLTTRREIENYLHESAIRQIYPSFQGTVDADCSVPELVARNAHESAVGTAPWDSLADDKKSSKVSQAKRRLASEVLRRMTLDQLEQQDPNRDVQSWLTEISTRLTAR